MTKAANVDSDFNNDQALGLSLRLYQFLQSLCSLPGDQLASMFPFLFHVRCKIFLVQGIVVEFLNYNTNFQVNYATNFLMPCRFSFKYGDSNVDIWFSFHVIWRVLGCITISMCRYIQFWSSRGTQSQAKKWSLVFYTCAGSFGHGRSGHGNSVNFLPIWYQLVMSWS